MTERGEPAPENVAPSGRDALPKNQRSVLAHAIRFQWLSIVIVIVSVSMVALVSGSSQAMKVAWIEDALSLLPPIAFLVAARQIGRRPDRRHPFGHHRSIGVAHVVSAAALLGMGMFLIIDSAITLIRVQKPPIGLLVLFGHGIWAGWVMIGVMLLTSIAPVWIGRTKMRYAHALHDKVMYADADMNKANWMSALATVAGILGIGVGLWWADAASAILVALSILRDGARNMRAAIAGLTDAEARTVDDRSPHPLIDAVEIRARETAWVDDALARVRDEGHVFHVEMFVVPVSDDVVTGRRCEELRADLADLDWKIHDVVVAPVMDLPSAQVFRRP